jgi:hypothetical protein
MLFKLFATKLLRRYLGAFFLLKKYLVVQIQKRANYLIIILPLIIIFLLNFRRLRGSTRNVAILRGRHDAPQTLLVKDEHRGASLQPRISALTLPISIAALAQWNVSICVVFAERYFYRY